MDHNEIDLTIKTLAHALNVQRWDIYDFDTFIIDTPLNKLIDHTHLKANADSETIESLFKEAIHYDFFSVCINPYWILESKKHLKNSSVKTCTVIGFPLGANTTTSKINETKDAIQNGTDEIDFVANLNMIKARDFDSLYKEFSEISDICSSKNVLSKVILETCYLTLEEITQLSIIAKISGLDFVKTSTGFGSAGATHDHIRLMRNVVGLSMGVKASGGIRTKEQCELMIANGASRLGLSSSVAIMNA